MTNRECGQATSKHHYRYRLSNTGSGSYRYGPCEICGKPASEIHIQIEEQMIIHSDGSWSWTHSRTLFGHRECLLKIQRLDAVDGGKSA